MGGGVKSGAMLLRAYEKLDITIIIAITIATVCP